MPTVVYTCFLQYCSRENRRFPAKTDAEDQGRVNRGQFTTFVVADTFLVAFQLNNPRGDETYKLHVRCSTKASGVFNARAMDTFGSRSPPNRSRVHRSNHQICSIPLGNLVKWPEGSECGPQGRFMPRYIFASLSIECTVTFPPSFGGLPGASATNTAMSFVLDYCRQNPEMLLTFKCGDGAVPAVIAVMMSRSPVIEAMMKADCIESRTKTVTIVDFSATVIRKLVEFCETSGVEDTRGFEIELYRLAEKYNVDSMKPFAFGLVTENLDEQNVVQMYNFARMYSDKNLQEYCVQFAAQDHVKILGLADVNDVEATLLKEFWVAVNESIAEGEQLLQIFKEDLDEPYDREREILRRAL